jgi:hypothetical protein
VTVEENFVVNKDMAPWARRRSHNDRLMRKLNVAISQLRAGANYESAAAVAEVLEVIRALPTGQTNAATMPNYGTNGCALTVAVIGVGRRDK